MRIVTLAMVVVGLGCGAEASAPQKSADLEASARGPIESATSPADPLAAATSAPERVATLKSPLGWIHASNASLFYIDRTDESERTDELFRVPLDGKAPPEAIFGKTLVRLGGEGEHLLAFDRDGEVWLVNGETKASRALGKADDATLYDGILYTARSETGALAIDAVPLASPSAPPRRLATIPYDGKLAAGARAFAAAGSGLYVALDEATEKNIRIPAHVFRVPLDGGAPQDLGTVTDVHDLAVIGSRVYVGSLAKAHEVGAAALTVVPSTYWDILESQGEVAYYVVATSLPQGGIGGWLYVWKPPGEPQRIFEELRNPQAFTVGAGYVYWIDGTSNEVLRLPRVDR